MDVPRPGGGKALRVIAANPNGIRAYFKNNPHEVRDIQFRYNPDIVIWNEIKGNESLQKDFTTGVEPLMPGYVWIWNHSLKAGQHGVAVAVKQAVAATVLRVTYGFEEDATGGIIKEPEGRIVTLEFPECFIIGLYAVNAGMNGLDRLQYKIDWMVKLTLYMEKLRSTGKTVVGMGDWNIAPTDLDVHDAKKCKGAAGFTSQEKECFRTIQARGWIDVFRCKNPELQAFTYWNGKTKDKTKRYGGWRIDHAVIDLLSVDPTMANPHKVDLAQSEVKILKEYMGSDHCPIMFNFTVFATGTSRAVPVVREIIPIVSEIAVVEELKPTKRYCLPQIVYIRKAADGTIEQGCGCYIGGKFEEWGLEASIWANPHEPAPTLVPKTISVASAASLASTSAVAPKTNKQEDARLSEYESFIRERLRTEWHIFEKAMLGLIEQPQPILLGCLCSGAMNYGKKIERSTKKIKEGGQVDISEFVCHGQVIINLLAEYIKHLNNGK